MADDKKEYRDTLLLLSHMGSGPAVLNKLDQLVNKLNDPRLKLMLGSVGQSFHDMPETVHNKKFRLLSWAGHYSANAGARKNLSNLIYTIQQYCQQHVASLVPQWQLIAMAHGWTPPVQVIAA